MNDMFKYIYRKNVYIYMHVYMYKTDCKFLKSS